MLDPRAKLGRAWRIICYGRMPAHQAKIFSSTSKRQKENESKTRNRTKKKLPGLNKKQATALEEG